MIQPVKEKVKTHEKPELNYTNLVTLALNSSPNGSMNVGEIYEFISCHFPFFNFGDNEG